MKRPWRERVAAACVAVSLTAAPAKAWGAPGDDDAACNQASSILELLEQHAAEGPRDGFLGILRRFEALWARALARQVANHCVRLNEIQVIGSHNSYHVQPRPSLFDALVALIEDFRAWEYTNSPLNRQFGDLGIRQIELDVFADPDGGLFASRAGLSTIGEDPASGLPELDQPGLKVLHIPDLDFETTCLTFIACLETIEAWSRRNPRHLPIMILIEAKDDVLEIMGFARPVPFGAEEFRTLEDEIRSVFSPDQLITPDDVRGEFETLEDAVLTQGWPTLAASRGRVLFALDNRRDAYIDGDPSLVGRVAFPDSTPGQPDAAFVKLNSPISAADLISDLVAQGYIVRTRADSDTEEARSGDTARRDAALASGAQYVSTDYPVPNPDFGTGYEVSLPQGRTARCNPINAPPGCRDRALAQARGRRGR